MKTRNVFKTLLVLDDEPGFIGQLEESFSNQGFKFLKLDHIDQVRSVMREQGYTILIHSCHNTKTYGDLCAQIQKDFPSIATIHLNTSSKASCSHQKKGRLHFHTGPLLSDKKLISKVKSLWHWGRLSSEYKNQKWIFKTQVELDEAVGSQETNEMTSNYLAFIQKQLKSDNVLWLKYGELDFYKNEMWKVKALSGFQVHSQDKGVCHLNPLNEKEITALVKAVSSKLPHGWTQALRTHVVNLESTKSKQVVVYPVQHKDKMVEGHIFVINPKISVDEAVLSYWMKRFSQSYKNCIQYKEAKSLCFVDDVTELYNQRYLGLALETEISRAARNNSLFSVLFIDIDHFKMVNDVRGHMVGTKLLKQLSKILKHNLRTVDYGFRYGGDEYLLLLVNTDSEAARRVGERIRQEVESTVFRVDGNELKLTLSIGIATYPVHANSKEEIIRIADQAMYHGKHKSRNIVFVAS